ncbi:JmjC domain-containing protein [Burkholderia cenocepacia]|uniref:JmjC domain-containing protein n=1 Tax=Burkholderia cenocepacia TaxID=95486 RepID=UPI002AB16F72|nr:cupin domain-containing protein [Burkholderia cenocepacia]
MLAENLLGNLTIESFSRQYLNKSHLLLRGVSRLPASWNFASFDDFLNSQEGQLHLFVKGVSDGRPIDVPLFQRDGPTQKRFIDATFNQGATFKISELERRSAAFSSICRELELVFGGHAVAKFFLTPPACKGFAPHFDHESVFVVQLAGKKNWKIYARSAVNPKRSMARKITEEEASKVVDSFTLEPGDVLYLPPGMPHSAQCDTAASLHVSVGHIAWTSNDVLQYAVNNLSFTEPTLNAPLYSSETYCSALIREALGRCIQTLQTLDPDSILADFRRSANSVRSPVNDRGIQNLSAIALLNESSVVTRNTTKIVEKFLAGEKIRLYLSDTSNVAENLEKQPPFVELPRITEGEIDFILRLTEPCAIKSIDGLLDNSSKVVLIKELIRHGVINAI